MDAIRTDAAAQPAAGADRAGVEEDATDGQAPTIQDAAAAFLQSQQQPISLSRLCKAYADEHVLADLEGRVGQQAYAEWHQAYVESSRIPGAAVQRTGFLFCIGRAKALAGVDEDDAGESLLRSLEVWEALVYEHQQLPMPTAPRRRARGMIHGPQRQYTRIERKVEDLMRGLHDLRARLPPGSMHWAFFCSIGPKENNTRLRMSISPSMRGIEGPGAFNAMELWKPRLVLNQHEDAIAARAAVAGDLTRADLAKDDSLRQVSGAVWDTLMRGVKVKMADGLEAWRASMTEAGRTPFWVPGERICSGGTEGAREAAAVQPIAATQPAASASGGDGAALPGIGTDSEDVPHTVAQGDSAACAPDFPTNGVRSMRKSALDQLLQLLEQQNPDWAHVHHVLGRRHAPPMAQQYAFARMQQRRPAADVAAAAAAAAGTQVTMPPAGASGGQSADPNAPCAAPSGPADVPAPRDERFATVTPRLFAAALTDVALTDGDVYGPRLQTVTFGGLKKVTLKRIRRVAHHDKVVVSAFDLFRVVQAHGGVREVKQDREKRIAVARELGWDAGDCTVTDPTAPDAEPMSLSALLATGDLNGKHEAHALIGEANKKIAESLGKLAPLRVPAAAADDDGEAARGFVYSAEVCLADFFAGRNSLEAGRDSVGWHGGFCADLELVDQLVPTKQLQQALRRQLPEGYTLDTAAGAPRVSLESVPFPAGLRPSARVLADAPVFASVMRQFAADSQLAAAAKDYTRLDWELLYLRMARIKALTVSEERARSRLPYEEVLQCPAAAPVGASVDAIPAPPTSSAPPGDLRAEREPQAVVAAAPALAASPAAACEGQACSSSRNVRPCPGGSDHPPALDQVQGAPALAVSPAPEPGAHAVRAEDLGTDGATIANQDVPQYCVDAVLAELPADDAILLQTIDTDVASKALTAFNGVVAAWRARRDRSAKDLPREMRMKPARRPKHKAPHSDAALNLQQSQQGARVSTSHDCESDSCVQSEDVGAGAAEGDGIAEPCTSLAATAATPAPPGNVLGVTVDADGDGVTAVAGPAEVERPQRKRQKTWRMAGGS